jgi:hypothetical protein
MLTISRLAAGALGLVLLLLLGGCESLDDGSSYESSDSYGAAASDSYPSYDTQQQTDSYSRQEQSNQDQIQQDAQAQDQRQSDQIQQDLNAQDQNQY